MASDLSDLLERSCSVLTLLESRRSLYPFGKYLELLCYADRLYPSDLCAHTQAAASSGSTSISSEAISSTASPLLRHFRHARSVVVTISLDHFDIYELKLGKLSVGPPVSSKTNAVPQGPASAPSWTGSDPHSSEADKARKEDLALEIEAYFVNLQKRFSALVSTVLSSSSVGPSDGKLLFLLRNGIFCPPFLPPPRPPPVSPLPRHLRT